jgi:uncharacterized protein (DUF983 family)
MSPPRLVVMPGASLLELTPVASGLRVRCPGCGQVRVFADDTTGPACFVHGDGCSVHRQIVDALRHYERTTVRRG